MRKTLFVLCCLFASTAMSEIKVTPKFIYVLHGGVDAIWGQYMFMVKNTAEAPASSEVKVTLPGETVDWQAQEGLAGIQFSLGENGGLVFTKEFKPGDNIHTVGFKVPATSGEGDLSLTLAQDVSELSFLSSGPIEISGENMKVAKRGEGQRYDKYHFYDLKKGDKLTISVTGVHVGRSEFWKYGWITFAVLLIGCFGLAFMTRPQQRGEV